MAEEDNRVEVKVNVSRPKEEIEEKVVQLEDSGNDGLELPKLPIDESDGSTDQTSEIVIESPPEPAEGSVAKGEKNQPEEKEEDDSKLAPEPIQVKTGAHEMVGKIEKDENDDENDDLDSGKGIFNRTGKTISPVSATPEPSEEESDTKTEGDDDETGSEKSELSTNEAKQADKEVDSSPSSRVTVAELAQDSPTLSTKDERDYRINPKKLKKAPKIGRHTSNAGMFVFFVAVVTVIGLGIYYILDQGIL